MENIFITYYQKNISKTHNSILRLRGLNLLWIAFSLMFISGCEKQLTKEELVEYINEPENGIYIEKSHYNILLKPFYKPSQLVAWSVISGDSTLTEKEKNEIIKKYKDYMYFQLSISRDNQELLGNINEGKQAFGEMVNQLAFGMQNTAYIITSEKDTLYPLDYAYPRTYGMSPSTDMLFVFERDKMDYESLKFCLDEFGLKTGNIKFKFLTKDINKVDQIDLKY